MKWPWQHAKKAPSALEQTTALIRDLIAEHEDLASRHSSLLTAVRNSSDLQEAKPHE